MSSLHDPLAPRSKVGVVLSDDRVELALRAYKEKARKSQIKKLLKAKFGLGFRAAEDVMKEARRLWAIEIGENPEAFKAESHAFYQSVVESLDQHIQAEPGSDASAKERYWQNKTRIEAARAAILAQQRIDKLWGLEAPTQQVVSGQVLQVSYADMVRAAQQAQAELGQVIDIPKLESKE